MIEFELSDKVKGARDMTHMVAEQMMRPISREYDEREHEKPWDFLKSLWSVSGSTSFGDDKSAAPAHGAARLELTVLEKLCLWGSAASIVLMLVTIAFDVVPAAG